MKNPVNHLNQLFKQFQYFYIQNWIQLFVEDGTISICNIDKEELKVFDLNNKNLFYKLNSSFFDRYYLN